MSAEPIPRDFWGDWRLWELDETAVQSASVDDEALSDFPGIYISTEDEDRKAWIKRLPHLDKTKYIVSWRGNNPQSLVDAVLKMQWLERLCFGRLGARDLSALSGLGRLEYLCIIQLCGPKDLSPIGGLPSLKVLEIGFNQEVVDLEWLSGPGLTKLRSLIVYGNKSRFPVSDLQPLAGLSALEYLSIPTLDPINDTLDPILELQNLKFLNLKKKAWSDTAIKTLEDRSVIVQLGIKPPIITGDERADLANFRTGLSKSSVNRGP